MNRDEESWKNYFAKWCNPLVSLYSKYGLKLKVPQVMQNSNIGCSQCTINDNHNTTDNMTEYESDTFKYCCLQSVNAILHAYRPRVRWRDRQTQFSRTIHFCLWVKIRWKCILFIYKMVEYMGWVKCNSWQSLQAISAIIPKYLWGSLLANMHRFVLYSRICGSRRQLSWLNTPGIT